MNESTKARVKLAEQKIGALEKKYIWMKPDGLKAEARQVRASPFAWTDRVDKMFELADKVNGALSEFVVCGDGCSACCTKLNTMIYESEALAMAKASGKKIKPRWFVPYDDVVAQTAQKKPGPCPFLVDNRCSIYEARPFICRVHATADDSSAGCGSRDPEFPQLNFDADLVEIDFHALMRERKEPYGRIQDFF